MGSTAAPVPPGRMLVHRLPWSRRAQTDLSLSSYTPKLMRWRLRLLELKFNVVHWADIMHQVDDASSRLRTTRTDQTLIIYKMPVLCITASNPSPKKERRVVCIWNNMTYLETRKVFGYLQYTPSRHRRNLNTKNCWLSDTILYINRQKIRTVAKLHLQSDYRDERLITIGISFWFVLHA